MRRELDGITLVFHRPSGLTHLLASPLPEILNTLDEEPLTVDALLACLAADYDIGSDDDAIEALSVHLEELAALGLIESRLCVTA